MNLGRALLVPLLLIGAAGCRDLGGAALFSASDASSDTAKGRDGGGVEHTVVLQSLAFCDELDCSDVSKIRVGDTITWQNNDTAFHEIAYGNYRQPPELSEELFHSPAIQVGEKWSYTFLEAGEYEYYCTNHKRVMNMATIVVEE